MVCTRVACMYACTHVLMCDMYICNVYIENINFVSPVCMNVHTIYTHVCMVVHIHVYIQ